MRRMRWHSLFGDLEAQASELERAQLAAEIDERTRGELGALALADRLRAAVDQPVRVSCLGGAVVNGVLARTGPDWLLIDEGSGREALVLSHSLASVRGLGRCAAAPDGVVAARLGVRHVLRAIARDRLPVRIALCDGGALEVTVDTVGADFVEVAVHAAGEARRRADVRHVELVALSAIAVIRRAV